MGVNSTLAATDLGPTEAPYIANIRLGDGGLSTDYNLSRLGTLSTENPNTIIHLAAFQKKAPGSSALLVRMMPNGWERWNGAAWLAPPITGAITGLSADRLCHAVMSDLLVMANGKDPLWSWDGVDADHIQPLSADAPVAQCICPLGQRLFAAGVKSGGAIDPYLVQWSTLGNIQDWTTIANGAGNAELNPEGRSDGPDFVVSLSAQETALVLYRQRTIVVGTLTGVGAQPLAFRTVVFGLGTNSPDTIVSLGHEYGDIFLGSDRNVYLFNGLGLSAPTLLSEPIRLQLQQMVQNPAICCAAFDKRNLKYWLLVDNGAPLPTIAWILDVKELMVNNRISWRMKTLTASGYASIAYSLTQVGAIPVVNSVSAIVNTVNTIVDQYGITPTTEGIVLGDGAGGVWYPDAGTSIIGDFQTRMLGKPDRNTGLDRVYLTCQSNLGGVVELSFSTDGGQTWQNAQVISVPAGPRAKPVSGWFSTVVGTWQFRIRILDGFVTVSELRTSTRDAGPSIT